MFYDELATEKCTELKCKAHNYEMWFWYVHSFTTYEGNVVKVTTNFCGKLDLLFFVFRRLNVDFLLFKTI